jgi:DNA-binding LacI/PurR family transcriptional regulator
MRITINDIAKATGFSKTAVSFAFNDPGRISVETKEKILKVADELGYVPDPVARNLSLKKLGTIGFLIPQTIYKVFMNPYMSQILMGIGKACEEEAYSLTILPPIGDNIFDAVRNAAVDGFITLGLEPEMKIVELIRHRHIPFVTIDGTPSPEVPSVNIDDELGAKAMMTKILEAGHRKIAILAIDLAEAQDDVPRSSVRDRRLAGMIKALKDYQLDIDDPALVIHDVESSLDGGRRIVPSLLDDQNRLKVTAIVTMSDITAIGTMIELKERGFRIPTDVSITGFDDIPEAALVDPALTTVKQPGIDKGLNAAKMLFNLLRTKAGEYRIHFHSTLITRDSLQTLPK